LFDALRFAFVFDLRILDSFRLHALCFSLFDSIRLGLLGLQPLRFTLCVELLALRADGLFALRLRILDALGREALNLSLVPLNLIELLLLRFPSRRLGIHLKTVVAHQRGIDQRRALFGQQSRVHAIGVERIGPFIERLLALRGIEWIVIDPELLSSRFRLCGRSGSLGLLAFELRALELSTLQLRSFELSAAEDLPRNVRRRDWRYWSYDRHDFFPRLRRKHSLLAIQAPRHNASRGISHPASRRR
jgi:hypothetical protein